EGDVQIVAQSNTHFVSLDVYYCRDKQKVKGSRNWVKQTMQKTKDGAYVSTLKLYDAKTPVIAFCNATFKNGVTISSNLLKFVPEKKFAEQQINVLQRTPVVYMGSWGTAEFTSMALSKTQKGSFVDENPISEVSGPFNIVGLSGTRMGSFVVSDDCMQISQNSLLLFDVCSKAEQDLNVYFLVDWGKETLTVYRHTCKLKGGFNWQKISLSAEDFKDETHVKSIKEFAFVNATLICFESRDGIVLNNVIFT
ncbi:MAG: hypothetical protein IKV38_00260, partial [Clostridia bacterium]|nr:hypothetical protein [Clostridia bacterium]